MGYHPRIFALREDGTELEIAIAMTASISDDDVMVVCTEYARWQPEPETDVQQSMARKG